LGAEMRTFWCEFKQEPKWIYRDGTNDFNYILTTENINMGKPAQIKTQQTSASVEDFINKVKDEQRRRDSFVILEIMKKVSGKEPKMWGASLIGFGNKRYISPNTGREVDWFLIGFSPRIANLSLHLVLDINKHTDTLKKLGKFKTGSGCLYINKLSDIDLIVLKKLIKTALQSK